MSPNHSRAGALIECPDDITPDYRSMSECGLSAHTLEFCVRYPVLMGGCETFAGVHHMN